MRRVIEARHCGGFRVWAKFDDGAEGSAGLRPLIGSFTGVFAPLGDPAVFSAVRAEHGTLVWLDEVDLCPEVLYAFLVHGVNLAA